MKSILVFLFSQSVLIPLVIGLVRLGRVGRWYQPFLILLWVGFFAELISYYVFIKIAHRSNAPASNIYSLIEWILIAWQFHVWGLLHTRKKAGWALVLFVSAIWVTENLALGHIYEFPPYFRFFDSFVIVLLSVNKINFMITHENRHLFRNPQFLICIGFIIYFIYRIVYEWAYQVSLSDKTEITSAIISGFAYINALTNVIFAIALLSISRPQKFVLR
jgi:hypothetical protein